MVVLSARVGHCQDKALHLNGGVFCLDEHGNFFVTTIHGEPEREDAAGGDVFIAIFTVVAESVGITFDFQNKSAWRFPSLHGDGGYVLVRFEIKRKRPTSLQ